MYHAPDVLCLYLLEAQRCGADEALVLGRLARERLSYESNLVYLAWWEGSW